MAGLTEFSEPATHPVHREVMAAWDSLLAMVRNGADVVSPMVAATNSFAPNVVRS